MSKDRPPVFTPLDRMELARYWDPEKIPGYELMMVSIEGPNGTGKSVIFKEALNAVSAAHLDIYAGELMPPVIGVVEPPDLKVDPWNSERDDTFRTLAKSGVSTDGVFSGEELSDPRIQAGLFLLSRRFVEREAFFRFPVENFHSCWMLPKGFFDPGIQVRNSKQLNSVEFAILVKDRGTGSTLVYQARDEKYGAEIRRQIAWAYEQNFLIRENMTILIMPRTAKSLVLVDDRDVGEPDQYSEVADLERYQFLKDDALIFTERLVELRNDPTGRSNSMTSPVLLATMLIVAEEQRLKGEVEIEDGKPFEIMFHTGKVIASMDWLNRLGSRGFYIDLPLIFGDSVTGIKPWLGYNYVNGDVGIIKVEYDRVKMVVERGLEDRLKKEGGQGQELDELYQRLQ
ncbi:hypothetical protein KKB40_00720 [Patescibacteria group bacterium]|nr:hypothetical protein [Patescibacteria group bacterium]